MPRAWLKKTLSHLAFNYLRHQKLRLNIEANNPESYLAASINMQPEITRLEVEDVLAALPVKDQFLLKMKMAGLTYAEMAEVMNVAHGSVGVMLMRALNKFKQAYEGQEGKGVNQKHELSRRRSTLIVCGEGTAAR